MPLYSTRVCRTVMLSLALAALAVVQMRAQADSATRTQSDSGSWVLVAAGPDYEAGGLWSFLFGAKYRDLWTTPTKIEVLNLQTYAGGLEPVSQGGGQQTKSLRFKAPDGREFNFRSVDKDPVAVLPPDLKGTFAENLVQDQISSSHPTGPLVADRLLSAVGVLHASPHLYVMPDDPALGKYRATFANMLGLLEEHIDEGATRTPGVESASKVIDMDKLLERLEERPSEHIDTTAWLRARLMDVYIGDWDRHRGQWRWARLGPDSSPTPWVPIPEDRDQVFVSYDGLLLSVASQTRPQLVKFGKGYSRITGATFNGRELDRQLFAAVDRPAWDSMASDLQGRLTDAVIDSAVEALPVQHFRIDGPRLREALQERRNNLPEMAEKYYKYLASEPDVHATDAADRVTITRGGGTSGDPDDVEVLIVGKDSVDGKPVEISQARRMFRDRDTDEFRIYLHGGDDSVYVWGSGSDEIKFRIIGGGGTDVVLDSSDAGGVRLYDTDEDTRLEALHGGSLRSRPYTRPDTTSPVPPRDWGNLKTPILWSGYAPDLGLFIGGGLTSKDYGFRKHPYASRHLYRIAYATEARTFRAEFRGEWRWENSGVHTNLLAYASGVEVLRFYGFGNETPNIGDNDFNKVQQDQFLLEPSITVPIARRLELTVGPRAQFNRLDEKENRFINTLPNLYGTGEFGQAGARLGLVLDTRDVPAAARKGFLVDFQGTIYPGIWDVQSTFGKITGEIATYLSASIRSRPTLALRVGGEKVFGTFPFHEAAYIGGFRNVRGWQQGRFAGDASLFGNAELRVHLTRLFLGAPADVGLFGLADVGRVYFDGEDSNQWHPAFGGGISLGFLQRANTFTMAIATSEERTGVYLRGGYHF